MSKQLEDTLTLMHFRLPDTLIYLSCSIERTRQPPSPLPKYPAFHGALLMLTGI